MNSEFRALGVRKWLWVTVLCGAAGMMLYWNSPRHQKAGIAKEPPYHAAPLPLFPSPTAAMESEVRFTLSDEFLNELVKAGADEARLRKLYGPPSASLTQDGVTITSYSPLIQKFHVIPAKAGRVGFSVTYRDGKPVKWNETTMGRAF